MAITIQSQPTSSVFYSVGNAIDILCSSTNTAQSNFKLIIKVYSMSNITLLATLYYDIIPSTTQIYADVSRVLKSKFPIENITNLSTEATGIKNETSKHYTANITCQEFYGTIPTATGSINTSNTFSIFNGSFKYKDWVNGVVLSLQVDSTATTTDTSKLLLTAFENYTTAIEATVIALGASYFTSNKNVRKIKAAQIMQLCWLWAGNGGTNAKIKCTAFNDTFGTTSGTLSLTSVNSLMSCNMGTSAIINSGMIAILGAAWKYLCISVWNNTYQVSASYLFEIDWSANCDDGIELHWLNKLGGWDSWIFDKRQQHNTQINRMKYLSETLPVSGSSISHSLSNATQVSSRTFTSEEYIINSDNLKEWELRGLEDLVTSPEVYWRTNEGFVSVTIQDTNFANLKRRWDNLFNLRLRFNIDNKDYRQ